MSSPLLLGRSGARHALRAAVYALLHSLALRLDLQSGVLSLPGMQACESLA